ncbi:MAG TPA: response regulator [Noviherbaspirillum sp.]|uniref:response regulator n=1 Tax=Noviherbaspirillum sp. TaxID=1926288 RepID=UPI002D6B17F1|nr:response regulator [Noviherbaspirillum sp.]HYD97217.1 response regulator [Noviherbaspirillum sp.]
MTTVLVVDDSKVSRLLSKQYILQRHPDWTIAEAASGEEAIDKVEAVGPDLILLDLNMPGMGGLAAVDQLQAKCPSARITLLTANVQDATREKANALGIGFAAKPITEALIDEILSAFGKQ